MSRPENAHATPSSDSAYRYSEQFVGAEAVEGYLRKFRRRADRIRHCLEVRILRRYVRGDCFDCSVGTARFVGELTGIRSYRGMDYSPDLIEHVRKAYPQIRIERGDLMKGIEAPDEAFDSVFCIRTLFALQGVEGIVREMARIARPGGRILFDYGTSPRDASIGGSTVVTSTTDIRTTAANIGLRVEHVYRLDSPFIMTIRKASLLRRAFNSRYNVLPNWLYEGIENICANLRAERLLYVLRKPKRGDVATEWRGDPA